MGHPPSGFRQDRNGRGLWPARIRAWPIGVGVVIKWNVDPHRKADVTRTRILLLCTTLLLAGCARESAPPRDVSVSVVAAESAAVPGGAVTLGWRFDLAPGWHLYTNGRSDTGLPPAVELSLPEGWTADAPLWPAGRRLESAGGILDHVYEDRLLLLQTLHAPLGARPGETVEIGARLEWLACREGCVPGDTLLTLALPVAAAAEPTRHAEELDRARGELPRAARAGELSWTWEGNTLVLRSPGASHLEYHPSADAGHLSDPRHDAVADGAVLNLRFRPRDGRVGPAHGVLLARAGETIRRLELTIPAAPAATQPQGDPR